MNKSTVILRLIKLKILADAINVPDDFTMSYNNDDFEFANLKVNLSDMEFSIDKLLNGDRYWFRYYNEWYKVLSKVYAKQYSNPRFIAKTKK